MDASFSDNIGIYVFSRLFEPTRKHLIYFGLIEKHLYIFLDYTQLVSEKGRDIRLYSLQRTLI